MKFVPRKNFTRIGTKLLTYLINDLELRTLRAVLEKHINTLTVCILLARTYLHQVMMLARK